MIEDGFKEIAKMCINDESVPAKNMTFNAYQEHALSTKIGWETGLNVIYPALGLTGEAGEVADKVKKVIRDKSGVFSDDDKIEILKELGDTLWYLTAIAYDLGYTLEDVAVFNSNKIAERRDNNTIHGEGDNR